MISSLTNSTIDIIEIYLFDVEFIDVFKLTGYEGLINALICLPLYSIKTFRSEVYNLFTNYDFNEVFCIIVYLLIYSILCRFKRIYKRQTLIQYSPNTRALAESI